MIDKKRLTEEFCELVAIDAPSFKERQMADALTAKLIEIGFEVTEDDAGVRIGGNAGNLYGYLPGTMEGDPIIFSSHMDTVPPAYGKQAVVHPDGKITSKGNTILGADDISGLVSILEAIRSLREDGKPHRAIEVLFPVAEEVFTKGCRAFDASILRSREVYVLDISGDLGRAAYRAPSILTFEIDMEGRAAHAGFAPETGVHAIQIVSKAIARLDLGRLPNEFTVNIGTIQGGEAVNIVPEHCYVKGEVRGFDHEAALLHLDSIRQVFEEEALAGGALLHWEQAVNCHAYLTDKNGKTALRYKEACEKEGITAQFIETFGGSDYNTLAEQGFEGLVIANAMYDIHSTKEYTLVDELYKSTKIVENIMSSSL